MVFRVMEPGALPHLCEHGGVPQIARRYRIGLTIDLLQAYSPCTLRRDDCCASPVNLLSVLAGESEQHPSREQGARETERAAAFSNTMILPEIIHNVCTRLVHSLLLSSV